MKKLIALVLATVLLAFSLVSCGYTENEWFSEEHLSKCFVPSFPTLDKDFLKYGDDTIYVDLSAAEYEAYLGEIYDYLYSSDFAYFGTRGEKYGSFKGLFQSYLYEDAAELEEFYDDGSYRFVYSDGSKYEDTSSTLFCIIVVSRLDSKRGDVIEYGGKTFKYNTVIKIAYETEYGLSGRYYVLEELHAAHSSFYNYDECRHWSDASCDCGIDNERYPHYDTDGDMLCDACQYSMKDAHCFEYVPSESSHRRVYICECRIPDVEEPHSDTDGDGACDVCGYSDSE